MKIGYARTSTVEQAAGLSAQIRDLKAHGCEEIFQEQVSSVQHRDELERLLKFARKGDCVCITKLDRLARSIPDLVKIIERLEQREVTLTVLDMNLDTSSPTGRLMLNLLGSVAQFEREIMLLRQREGIAAAKSRGAYKGRQPTARAKSTQVLELHNQGMGVADIAKELEVSRASVYRILADQPKSQAA